MYDYTNKCIDRVQVYAVCGPVCSYEKQMSLGNLWLKKMWLVTNLSQFRVTQLVEAQFTESTVKLQQLQAVASQTMTDQKIWEAMSQEKHGAEMSLIGHEDRGHFQRQ